MLTIKNKLLLWKLAKLTDKRNTAFVKGDYTKATEYGKKVDHYISDVLKLEDGVPY